MKILSVFIQHAKASLDRPFTYYDDSEKQIFVGSRVIVPFNNTTIMGYVDHVEEKDIAPEELEDYLGFEVSPIVSVVDTEVLINEELIQTAEEVAKYYLAPKISVLKTMLPASLKPTLSALKGPKVAYDTYVELLNQDEEGLTPKQIELVRYLAKTGTILKKEAGSAAVLDGLKKKERIRFYKQERSRLSIPDYQKEEQPRRLSKEQEDAVSYILSCEKEVILLQGVTGSGKTEVYLNLCEAYLEKGKTTLMLVPEISLTPIMVEYFSRRFGGKIAILHSGLTPAEKYDEYRRIARGEAQIVVGARSAVFAPLENIGLIILDEEHVESYKQDSLPYYHAREVAIMRAKHFDAKVVLGSATPSLESKARAERGLYGLARLTRRINDQALPKAKIIDMRVPRSIDRKNGVFTFELEKEIKDRLEKEEQIILLVNRRGYASVICADCGYIHTCPSCHGNLTYHREDEMLKCHHCGYVELYPEVCPQCGSPRVKRVGLGTERVVKILGELFPDAKVGRLDGDIAKARTNIPKVLQAFREREFDILVGTQMVAKGHDFPKVTLAGLVSADQGLSMPSYRSSETTFGLIAQTVGRSGRGQTSGTAIIQTFNPYHYAVTFGASQDYEGFFRKEMEQRKLTSYPPYYYLIAAHFTGKDEEKTLLAASEMKKAILDESSDPVLALGPITPYYSYVNERYKKVVLFKTKKPDSLKDVLRKISSSYAHLGGIDIVFDVDPLDY